MALPINIKNLITNNVIESERIEFKEGWNPHAILHTICGFANDFNNIGGGYIIVGVDEKNGLTIMPPKGIDANQSSRSEVVTRSGSFFAASRVSSTPIFALG